MSDETPLAPRHSHARGGTLQGAGVNRDTSGMAVPAIGIDPRVENVWGLTRRRALDFGRMTAAGC